MDPLAPLRPLGSRLATPAEALAQAIAERVISLVDALTQPGEDQRLP